ncbi:MAG: hypothetical protein V1494_03095 [Candidatus Diapherotrites archaeon]
MNNVFFIAFFIFAAILLSGCPAENSRIDKLGTLTHVKGIQFCSEGDCRLAEFDERFKPAYIDLFALADNEPNVHIIGRIKKVYNNQEGCEISRIGCGEFEHIIIEKMAFVSEADCSKATGCICAAWDCDVIPGEKTVEETCGEHFLKGWNCEMKILSVSLAVSAPLSVAEIKIDRNGGVIYTGKSGEMEIGETDSAKITAEEFGSLISLIGKNSFFSFDREYIDRNLMDGTGYKVTVNYLPSPPGMDYGTYSVSCYGECPKEMEEIIQKIERLWAKEILVVGM